MKKIVCALIAAMLLILAVAPAMAISIRGVNPGDKLYVNTANGGRLNVRASASAKAKVMYKIDYGTKVTAGDSYDNGYLYVTVKGHSEGGWVDIRYLSASKPGPKPTSQPAPQTEETVASLNFRSYKLVDKETIIAAKPSRPSGFVNLRWVPSTQAAVICRMADGEQMKVIAEGNAWYQVQCDDGHVGFIYKKFTTVVFVGDTADTAAVQ